MHAEIIVDFNNFSQILQGLFELSSLLLDQAKAVKGEFLGLLVGGGYDLSGLSLVPRKPLVHVEARLFLDDSFLI